MGIVVHVCNFNTWEVEAGVQEFKTSLYYTVKLRLAWITWHCSKNKPKACKVAYQVKVFATKSKGLNSILGTYTVERQTTNSYKLSFVYVMCGCAVWAVRSTYRVDSLLSYLQKFWRVNSDCQVYGVCNLSHWAILLNLTDFF